METTRYDQAQRTHPTKPGKFNNIVKNFEIYFTLLVIFDHEPPRLCKFNARSIQKLRFTIVP